MRDEFVNLIGRFLKKVDKLANKNLEKVVS